MQLDLNLLFSQSCADGSSYPDALDTASSLTGTGLTRDGSSPSNNISKLDYSGIAFTPKGITNTPILGHKKWAKRFTRSQLYESQSGILVESPGEPETPYALERRCDVEDMPVGVRLWHMVNELDHDMPHLIHWSDDGTAFMVDGAKTAVKELMAFLDRYFVRCSSFKSFHRLLNRLGFTVKTAP